MGVRNEDKDIADRLSLMLENLDGTPAEELQVILSSLNPNAEVAEQEFIGRLRLMRQGLEASAGVQITSPRDVTEKDEAPLRGLVSEARKRGLATTDLADATQLSPSLVMKLDLRQIRYASIPRQVIKDIAGALQRSAEQVALYLQGDPIRTAVLYSDTDAAGESQEQRDFPDEVRADASLAEERRSRLVAMME
jgi:hypothetical protein